MSNPSDEYLPDAHEEFSLGYLLSLTEDQDEDDCAELEEQFLAAMSVAITAICDARLRFLYFAVAATGGVGDLVAYEFLSIHEIFEGFPDGIYFVADAAYMLSQHVLVPFTGDERPAGDFDTLNYFLSRLFGSILKWYSGCLPPNGRHIVRRQLELS